MSRIQIRTVRIAVYCPGHGWASGVVKADSDGNRVTFTTRDGWRCDCDDEQDVCRHITDVAVLIAPDVLEAIADGMRWQQTGPQHRTQTRRPRNQEGTRA